MLHRRAFLASAAVAACAPALLAKGRTLDALRERAGDARDAESLASDEDFWLPVQQAFMQDRSIINLNNGGTSPCPTHVHEALKLRLDEANRLPPPYALWQLQHPQYEVVRRRLARHWGVDPEELALTRNSSESLMICQLGIDLKPGDEIVTSTQDYPRMLAAFRQREAREGVKLVQVKLPVPCEDDAQAVRRFEEAITPRTRLILVSHVINLTGQILPVKQIVAMARTRNGGVPVIVDGAHALAQFRFSIADLGCDYYGVSLHKWLHAPVGTGLLYVRRDKVATLWPLTPAPPGRESDIRKFEEIGTHPEANILCVAEALTFHQLIGDHRKEARLRFLRERWTSRLAATGRATFNTPASPRHACAIGNVRLEGLDTARLQGWLWDKHRILTVAILHEECTGLRVSPSIYTTIDELDRFGDAIEHALAHGIG